MPGDRAIDGISILPVFEGRPVRRTIPLYWRYNRALSKPYTVAMRQGDWKLLADDIMTQFELYNLRVDRAERKNLVLSEAGRLEAMKKTLAELHHEIDAEGPQWPQPQKKLK